MQMQLTLRFSHMPTAIARLPDNQIEALGRAYTQTIRAKRQVFAVGVALLAVLFVVFGQMGEVSIAKLITNFWRFPDYFSRTIPPLSLTTLPADLAEWFWGFRRWVRLLGETIVMAYLGTIVGALGAFLLCFAASANLVRSRTLVFVVRRFFEICRSVPVIVFALIFVVAFGLGPLPGVIAVAIHTFGALGKLFAEVVENMDSKPVEGVLAAGANWFEKVRFAAVPQVLSNFVSYALLRFEINVREAAVMGFVGAGGIGQDLIEAIRKFYYTDVSAILILIIAAVVLIDAGTERVRHMLLGIAGPR